MKRGQVFVRAQLYKPQINNEGVLQTFDNIQRWVNADALDLDQESFNAFVLSRLGEHVVRIKDEFVEGDHITYYIDPSKVAKYEKEDS